MPPAAAPTITIAAFHRRRPRRRVAVLLLCLPAAIAFACGDDSVRPDPVPGTYTLRTVNGAVMPWVTTWPAEDNTGRPIYVNDSVRLSALSLKPENHEFEKLDSGSWSSPGYESIVYAYRFSGTYALLQGDTVRFTATSATIDGEPLRIFGYFPDTTYGVLTAGRLQMVEEFFATERPAVSGGTVGSVTFQSFTKSYAK